MSLNIVLISISKIDNFNCELLFIYFILLTGKIIYFFFIFLKYFQKKFCDKFINENDLDISELKEVIS